MTPTEFYNHISEEEGIPMQELNPLQYELMQIAEEAEGIRERGNSSYIEAPEYIRELSSRAFVDNKMNSEKIERLRAFSDEAISLALEVVYEMPEERFDRDNSLGEIATTVANMGDINRSLLIAGQIHDTHAPRINTLCEIGRVSKRIDLITRAKDLAMQVKDLFVRSMYLRAVAVASCDVSGVDSAISTIDEISDTDEKSHAQSMVVKKLLENGEVVRATELATAIHMTDRRAGAYAEIADYTKNSELLSRAIDETQVIEPNAEESFIFGKLAQVAVRMGEYEQAYAILEKMQNGRDNVLNKMIEGAAETNQIEKAMDFTDELTGGWARILARIRIAEVSGDMRAIEGVESMIDGVDSLSDKLIMSPFSVAEALARIAAVKKDPDLAKKAKEKISSINQGAVDAMYLRRCAPLFAQAGAIGEAFWALSQIRIKRYEVEALTQIALVLHEQAEDIF